MISVQDHKRLSNLKHDIGLFNVEFGRLFTLELTKAVTSVELMYLMEMLDDCEWNTLRITLGDMTHKARRKFNEGVEVNKYDEVYEHRYRHLKNAEDLLSYYLEEIMN